MNEPDCVAATCDAISLPSGFPPHEGKRSLAILRGLPDRESEPAGLVGAITCDAGAGKDDNAGRHDREHLVITTKRSGLGVLRPSRRRRAQALRRATLALLGAQPHLQYTDFFKVV